MTLLASPDAGAAPRAAAALLLFPAAGALRRPSSGPSPRPRLPSTRSTAALKANDDAALVAIFGEKHKSLVVDRRRRLRHRQARRGRARC